MQGIWVELLQLGLNGRLARAAGRVQIPVGDTVEGLLLHMPRAAWQQTPSKEDQPGVLVALNRPSWLLGGPGRLQEFLGAMYERTEWSRDDRIVQDARLVLEEQLSWGVEQKCWARFARANGLALSLWVDSTSMVALLQGYRGEES
mgnify:FL=1